MDGPILVIDRDAAQSIGVQLVDGLRRGILRGALRPGDAVPSTRALAAELGVSRSAVVTAYEQLAGEGYLEMRQGAPTRVADLARGGAAASVTDPPSSNRRELRVTAGGTRSSRRFESGRAEVAGADAPRIDLLPGRPATTRFDTRAWRAAWRAAAARDIPSESPAPFGAPGLRDEIADHLRIARGVECEASDIVVTAGTSEALSLSASAMAVALGRPPVVAVEHPGYPSARRTLELHGARTVPVPVDADGLDVGELRRMPQPPDAVMVTPSHQYPLGGRLPVAARLELLDWAREAGAIVLEDDYDSEYRHLGPPLPALASLDDAGRAVLVGSFSKVLTPWLRLGYLVMPENPQLRAAYARMRADDRCPVPGVVQDAAASLLASGAVRRHIAVTRRDYAHRRALVLEALDGLPGAPLSGLDGGLHAVVRMRDLAASDAVIARLGAEGVAVAPLAEYSAVPGDEQPGFVIGYAGVGDTQLAEGLERIRAAILAVDA
ncbi:MAG TPA: PLP-dependent aminotransferase family protein [Agromyces sp.]